MTQEYVQLVGCSRERQLPRDGNNVGKLMRLAGSVASKVAESRTEGFLFENEEDRVQQLKIFGQII